MFPLLLSIFENIKTRGNYDLTTNIVISFLVLLDVHAICTMYPQLIKARATSGYDDKYSKPVKIYRGSDAVHRFMGKMLDEVKWCNNIKRRHDTN